MNVVTVITAKGHNHMKHFTIDKENDIRVHASAQEADAVTNAERFSTSAGLAKLADKWPAARLVEIWNSLPGAAPVKKFTDRKTAATRIWNVIRSLGETPAAKPEGEVTATELAPEVVEAMVPAEFQPEPEAAEPAPASQPEQPSAEPAATEPPIAPLPAAETVATVGAQGADVAPTTPSATKKAARGKKTHTEPQNAKEHPRENSKTSKVIEMLRLKGGCHAGGDHGPDGLAGKHTTRAMLSRRRLADQEAWIGGHQ